MSKGPIETSPLLGRRSFSNSSTANLVSQDEEEAWIQCPDRDRSDEDAIELLDRSKVLQIILVLLIGAWYSRF